MSEGKDSDHRSTLLIELLGSSDGDSLEIAEIVTDSAIIRPEVEDIAELARLATEVSEVQLISHTTT